MKNAGYPIAKVNELPDYYKGQYVYQHVLVAEQMLGRMLAEGECVHHKDLNKKNNDPSNLMVFASLADHSFYHQGAEAYLDGDVWKVDRAKWVMTRSKKCPICGKTYYVKDAKEMRKRKYCSYACARKATSKAKGGNSDEILQRMIFDLYKYNGNFTAVAKLYGIHANAIINRLKRKNLAYHSSDYRNLINASLV